MILVEITIVSKVKQKETTATYLYSDISNTTKTTTTTNDQHHNIDMSVPLLSRIKRFIWSMGLYDTSHEYIRADMPLFDIYLAYQTCSNIHIKWIQQHDILPIPYQSYSLQHANQNEMNGDEQNEVTLMDNEDSLARNTPVACCKPSTLSVDKNEVVANGRNSIGLFLFRTCIEEDNNANNKTSETK